MQESAPFETTLKPAPKALIEELGPPGMSPDWATAKSAQLRLMDLERLIMKLVPAAAFFLIGIFVGMAALPVLLKYVLVAVASLVLSFSIASFRFQKAKTDALFKKLRPDSSVKIVKEKE